MVADLVRPGSKRKLQDSDVSVSSEKTAVMEEEDLITFDYEHFDADSPSTKNVDGNGLNLANLQFNTLNIIGMLMLYKLTPRQRFSCGRMYGAFVLKILLMFKLFCEAFILDAQFSICG